MALKIVQELPGLGINTTGVTTSDPISLQSGYLRITPNKDCHVTIGTNPVATTSSLLIPANKSEIIKERVARQKIVGITTGSSTVINFGQNNGNPFVVGDYITISNALPSGINTSYKLVTATSENPLTGDTTITINFNSTSVSGIITTTNAYAARSIKVSGLSDTSVGASGGTGVLNITEVQIASSQA